MTSQKTSFFRESVFIEYPSSEKSRSAVLFLHGFPADTGKNEDIARRLSESAKVSSFVFHYPGLGQSNGKFLFTNSLTESAGFLEYLLGEREFSSVSVVGHSWGGLNALNLLNSFPQGIDKLILLAPFCVLPSRSEVESQVNEFIDYQIREGRNHSDAHTLVSDFENARHSNSPLEIAKTLSNTNTAITIIQGLKDTVSAPIGARTLHQTLGSRCTLIEINDDHWFKDRDRLFTIVDKILNDRSTSSFTFS
mgnify:CR=1 FL=1